MNKESFLDVCLGKGYITPRLHMFLEDKKEKLSNKNLNDTDLIFIYHMMEEKDVVSLFNQTYGTDYKCVLDYEITDELLSMYRDMPSDIFPLAYNKENKELVITGLESDEKAKVREIMMTLGLSNIKYIKGFNCCVRKIREKYTGKIDGTLAMFVPSDMFRVICLDAIDSKATDIHLKTFYNEVKAEYEYKTLFRVASELEDHNRFPVNKELNEKIINNIIQLSGDGSGNALDTPGGVETSIANLIEDGDWAARVSAGSVLGGYMCVVRLHRTKDTAKTLEELGFDDEISEGLRRLGIKEKGVTFVTGKTGCGKNTTVNSLLKYVAINTNKDITEFSNPVEVLLPRVNQIPFKTADDLLTLINVIKKRDPNLVFVGEIPGLEVARGVKELVDSDIQVITTTHIDRCWSIIQKLYDYYGDEYINILDKINAVVTQVMFKKLCPHCRENITNPNSFEFTSMFKLGVNKAYRAHLEGCDKCGYRGHLNEVIPRAELLEFNTNLVRDLLDYRTPIEMSMFLKDYVYSHGLNIEKYVARLVEDGVIDIAQVKKRNLCD